MDDSVARLEQALSRLWRVSSSRAVHEARMRSLGLALSRTDVRFLRRLAAAGALSVSRLADELDLSQPTASRSLQRLDAEGLVRRSADSSDARRALYTLTAKGAKVWRRIAERTNAQLADALTDIPPRRRAAIADAVDELAERLRRPQPDNQRGTA